MDNWAAEIMSDPDRGNRLHVELKEGDVYRARLYQDDADELQIQLYDGHPGIIPVRWLLAIIEQYRADIQRLNS